VAEPTSHETAAPSEARLPPRPSPPRPVSQRVVDWITWFGPGRLVTVALSVAAIGAGGFWLLRAPPPPVEASLPVATSAPPSVPEAPHSTRAGDAPAGERAPAEGAAGSASTTAAPADVVVHVAGAVVAPGVRRLPPGARVVDAVDAAGGPSAEADVAAINLAQQLRDGDRVYVPRVDEATPVPVGVSSSATAPAGVGGGAGGDVGAEPVDLNEAPAELLETLPGIGPATAAAIVAHREQQGPFASVDDLASVRGIGPAKLDGLRELVTV